MAEEIKIQQFNGQDYNLWKKRILLYLKMKKCDEVAIRPMLSSDNSTAWAESNLKAMNYIYCGISNEQLEFVSNEETAYNILKKFDEMYSRESTAIQICVRNRLEKIKLQDYDDSSVYFTDFEKLINELKSSGATVTEKEKLNYMLRTLPESLSYIGDLIDAVREQDQTCEFVKNKIKMWEIRDKTEQGKNVTKSSAFKGERKNLEKRTCYKCGKLGHIKANCRTTGLKGNFKTQNSTDQVYLQGGGSTNYRGNNFNTHGYVQRGRGGYFNPCQIYNPRGRGAMQSIRRYNQNKYCNRDSNCETNTNESSVFDTELNKGRNNIETMNTEVNSCDKREINWVIDSGCTDHIINNDAFFDEFVTLQKPIDVKVGDGRCI